MSHPLYHAIRLASQLGSEDAANNAPMRNSPQEHPDVQKAYLNARQRYTEAMERVQKLSQQRNMSPAQIIVQGVTRLWDNSIEEEKPAKGVAGTLLVGVGGRDPIFRVYKHPTEYRIEQTRKKERNEPHDDAAWEFIDYDIAHYDPDIIIDEDHASLIRLRDGRCRLDYDSATLNPSPEAVAHQFKKEENDATDAQEDPHP